MRAGCDAAGGLGFFLSRVPNSSLTETVGRPPGHRHIPHHRHHLAAGNRLVVRQAWHRIGCGGAAGGGGEEEEQASQRAERRAGPAEWLHGAGRGGSAGGEVRSAARARSLIPRLEFERIGLYNRWEARAVNGWAEAGGRLRALKRKDPDGGKKTKKTRVCSRPPDAFFINTPPPSPPLRPLSLLVIHSPAAARVPSPITLRFGSRKNWFSASSEW